MKKLFFIIGALSLLLACGKDDVKETIEKEELTYTVPPFKLDKDNHKFSANIKYGEATRNVFDLFLPESESATPLVLFFHGGGFTTGDKSDAYQITDDRDLPAFINSLLNKGVAFASVNYRLLQLNDKEGVIKSLKDSKLCLQHIRLYAERYNIKKDQIVLVGASAGAGTALWIALKDDMADSKAEKPEFRESTRVSGVVAIETQASYDLQTWETKVFSDYTFNLKNTVTANPAFTIIFNSFYGIQQYPDFESESGVAYRKNINMLAEMDHTDPELYLKNVLTPEKDPGTNLYALYHHPYHVRALKQQADQVNLAAVAFYEGKPPAEAETEMEFIFRKLQK